MTERYSTEFSDGETLSAGDLNDTFEAAAPVGTVTAWHKDFANTPALPAGWAECNGQTLNNADSPYDGQTLPDLNGNNRFLRGNGTSGGTGGSSTVALSVSELPSHTHSHHEHTTTDFNEAGRDGQETGGSTGSTGGDSAHENKPPYFDVVWVIKVT